MNSKKCEYSDASYSAVNLGEVTVMCVHFVFKFGNLQYVRICICEFILLIIL